MAHDTLLLGREYVFIPLGGARKGPLVLYRNLIIAMVLVGFWHGARWTFVLFGVYQGMLLAAIVSLTR